MVFGTHHLNRVQVNKVLTQECVGYPEFKMCLDY